MQIRIPAALLCCCIPVCAALAEIVVVNDQVQVRESQIDRPRRGSTMSEVEKRFGAPTARRPTVGGNSPHQPPITRWDYNGFSVVFERDRVIDTVVTGGETSAPASQSQQPASEAQPASESPPQQPQQPQS
jgi:hypothetical protein